MIDRNVRISPPRSRRARAGSKIRQQHAQAVGLSDGHAHRFRHTFAVELLLAGVPIERVSVLLGHSSARITEKHYSAWVRARQEQLEADVRQSWALESSLLSSGFGTNLAGGETEVVN